MGACNSAIFQAAAVLEFSKKELKQVMSEVFWEKTVVKEYPKLSLDEFYSRGRVDNAEASKKYKSIHNL